MAPLRKKVKPEDLKKAAAKGDVEAQKALGLLYELGLEVEANDKEALKYWEKAAESGDNWAAYSAGSFHKEGRGTKADSKAAEKWLAKAEKGGFAQPEDKVSWLREEHKAAASTKGKVLIVDDDRQILELLKSILELENYSPLITTSTSEALQLINKNPDLKTLIIDIIMPEISGLQFIKTIRRMGLMEGVPIIVMTAHSKSEYIKAAKNLKLSGWLTKPFDRGRLLETMNSLLTSKVS
jgi:CheY-like chemotaxis protein